LSKITIEIDTGNAAFHEESGGGYGEEVARILEEAAERFRESGRPNGPTRFAVRDINGNRVGQVVIEEDEADEDEADEA